MPTRHAIVIAIDGLRASALGAYGNTWHPTPSLDLLASQSRVFDWLMADAPTLEGFYRAVWSGLAAPLDGDEQSVVAKALGASIAARLAASGVQSAITTDSEWVAERAEAIGFEEVRRLEFPLPTAAAESVADTELAQLVAIAADQIQALGAADAASSGNEPEPSRLLWIHARGYHGAWDAPLEIRQTLLDDDEVEAPTFVAPPENVASDNHDELLLYRAAYAAQTVVLDECIGVLTAALEEAGLASETLVVLVGCRGFALGEHGAVGAGVKMLYGEQLHLPLLLRVASDAPIAPPRSPLIVQPQDLLATLLDWFGAPTDSLGAGAFSLLDVEAEETPPRPIVAALGQDGEMAVRTSHWMLRQPARNGETSQTRRLPELYAKPDDRWEANEIADRCVEETAELLAAAERYRSGEPLNLNEPATLR